MEFNNKESPDNGLQFVFSGSSTFCVLADKVAIRVSNLMKRNLYDIVKVDWFRRCVDAEHWLPW